MPTGQLAQKIATVTGAGTIALRLVNRSSLNPSAVEEIRRALVADLAALGVRSVSDGTDAISVQVTLSENLNSYVWIAEIFRSGREPAIVMVELAHGSPRVAEPESAAVVINKALIWTSERRILDVALLDIVPPRMIVLDTEQAALYVVGNHGWDLKQALAIVHTHPWPRDLRGRLSLHPDGSFEAYLPGVICKNAVTTPFGFDCSEGDDPWPLSADQLALKAFFAPSRNFFTGALSAGNQRQSPFTPFYSAAGIPGVKNPLWLLAAVDGQIHVLDGSSDQILGNLAWGSDIASIRSGCGARWQILASANGDGPGDAVQAFQMADRQPVPVSRPTEFPGRILALWTESDGASVMAVVQNTESAKYEAYRLSVICGQ